MKYLNFIVFLSLIVLVTGCQKKEPFPTEHKTDRTVLKKQAKPKLERRGATKMQTKRSKSQN